MLARSKLHSGGLRIAAIALPSAPLFPATLRLVALDWPFPAAVMDMGLIEENVSAVKAVRLQQSFDHRHPMAFAR
jgi:hypothetical protein